MKQYEIGSKYMLQIGNLAYVGTVKHCDPETVALGSVFVYDLRDIVAGILHGYTSEDMSLRTAKIRSVKKLLPEDYEYDESPPYDW